VNAVPPTLQRQKQAALVALLGASVVLGIVEVALGLPMQNSPDRLLFTFVGNLALLVLGFRWLQLDARELDIRRPLWLNVGIVLLAAVFVPYYLFKTRPPERRLVAIAAFFGVVVACMLASAFGAMLMGALSGTPAPAPAAAG
jgi:peptidoglycan/LPS O-acetylase OafA/YrhL